MRRLVLWAALLAVFPGVPCGAQSLGDAAAREKERRRAKEKAGERPLAPTFTDQDLSKGRPPAKEPAAGEAPAAAPRTDNPPASDSGGAPDSQGATRVEAARRARQEAVRNVEGVQARIDAARQKLNPLSPSFVTDTNGQLRLQDELRQAEAQLAAAQEAVAEADRALAKAEEDARRSGSSPASRP